MTETQPAPAAGGTRIPGEAGMWVFIFGDMMLFVIYFSNYLAARRGQLALFRAGHAQLNPGFGALNTVVLLLSSLFVVLGLRAVRAGDAVRAPRLFAGALACAFAFIAVKALEWSGEIARGLTIATDSFSQFYYILTGLHLVHVVFGVVVLGLILRQSRRGAITPRRLMVVEGGCCWWHMVDLIWMILFPLVYLAA